MSVTLTALEKWTDSDAGAETIVAHMRWRQPMELSIGMICHHAFEIRLSKARHDGENRRTGWLGPTVETVALPTLLANRRTVR